MQALCSFIAKVGYACDMRTGRPSKRPRPSFGQRLYTLRIQAGLTQAQVAQKLDVSQRAYAFWEREPIALRADQLVTLAGVLGVTADLLVGCKPAKHHRGGPAGKMRQLFEAASSLPRSQQQKITAVLEPFVIQHANIQTKGAPE